MIEAQQDLPAVISKDGQGHRKPYTTLEHILQVVRPILSGCQIALFQVGVWKEGRFFCETQLVHYSGRKMTSLWPVIPQDKDNKDPKTRLDHPAQEEGKGWSYARRYGILAILGCGSGDADIDGQDNAYQPGQGNQQRNQPQQQQAPPPPPAEEIDPQATPQHHQIIKFNAFINEHKQLKGEQEVQNILAQYFLGTDTNTWLLVNMQAAAQLIKNLPNQG